MEQKERKFWFRSVINHTKDGKELGRKIIVEAETEQEAEVEASQELERIGRWGKGFFRTFAAGLEGPFSSYELALVATVDVLLNHSPS